MTQPLLGKLPNSPLESQWLFPNVTLLINPRLRELGGSV